MSNVREFYPTIFDNSGRPVKPSSRQYKEFSQKWSWTKTYFELSEDKIENLEKTAQVYLSTALEFLCYLIDKSIAEEAESEYQRKRNQK